MAVYLLVFFVFAFDSFAAVGRAATLHDDERILFYPTIARPVRGGLELSLHGIVYEPERRALMTWLAQRLTGLEQDDLTAAEWDIFQKRCRYFLVDHERGKKLSVRLDTQSFPLSTSAANGHFTADFKWKTNGIVIPEKTSQGAVSVSLKLAGDSIREFPVDLHILESTGLSVISDIDDTIKISDVLNRDALLRNTFCRPFKAVTGMADVYREWARTGGAQFHYVTASPWQLYLPLSDFIRAEQFPAGTFHMKDFRIKDGSALALFAAPERYKPGVIEPLLRRFPQRKFVLVGDSGEKDPEIYGALKRKYSNQIRVILIREVRTEPQVERYAAAFRDLPSESFLIFKNPAEILNLPSPVVGSSMSTNLVR